MAGNPLRWTSPRVLASELQQVFTSLTNWLNLRLMGTSFVGLWGAPPSTLSGSTFLMQAGSTSVVLDASGFGNITFTEPFPNGLLTVVANFYGIVGSADHIASVRVINFAETTGFRVATNTPSTTKSVSWIAIGW